VQAKVSVFHQEHVQKHCNHSDRISHPPNMKFVIPIDLRANPVSITMGNQLSHLCLELPMHIEGNIPVLWALNDKMKQVKENGDYATMHLFTHLNYLLLPIFLGRHIQLIPSLLIKFCSTYF
jgi:hypothetical protein